MVIIFSIVCALFCKYILLCVLQLPVLHGGDQLYHQCTKVEIKPQKQQIYHCKFLYSCFCILMQDPSACVGLPVSSYSNIIGATAIVTGRELDFKS